MVDSGLQMSLDLIFGSSGIIMLDKRQYIADKASIDFIRRNKLPFMIFF